MKQAILLEILTVLFMTVLTACGNSAESNHSQEVTDELYTADTAISDVIEDPVFGDYGRLIFPVDDWYYSGDTLADLHLTFYSNINPDETVEIANYMKEHAASGDTIFYDIYTEEEKAADPQKADTGLFFFKGNPGERFAVCNAGGAFAYVGAIPTDSGSVHLIHAREIINRLCCTFSCKTYQIGPKKRVGIIYNLADTFFIGQFGNPYMVATFLFSMLTLCFHVPLLRFLGASDENFGYAQTYLLWVVVIGGIPTMLSMTLAHLLRSEGHAKHASAGMMFGGILNIVLDPLLMFAAGMGFVGSAVATACSNFASVLFFFIIFYRLRGKTALSLSVRNFSMKFARPIFSVGIASAMITVLANASNMVIVKLASGYGDIPVAAYGIVKRIDLFPLGISMGLCQGFILMNWIVGLYGMIWTQLIIETPMLPVTIGMYAVTWRKLVN